MNYPLAVGPGDIVATRNAVADNQVRAAGGKASLSLDSRPGAGLVTLQNSAGSTTIRLDGNTGNKGSWPLGTIPAYTRRTPRSRPRGSKSPLYNSKMRNWKRAWRRLRRQWPRRVPSAASDNISCKRLVVRQAHHERVTFRSTGACQMALSVATNVC